MLSLMSSHPDQIIRMVVEVHGWCTNCGRNDRAFALFAYAKELGWEGYCDRCARRAYTVLKLLGEDLRGEVPVREAGEGDSRG